VLKGKVTTTWNITLNAGQSWQKTIAWTTNTSIIADLYTVPNTTTPSNYTTNGACLPDTTVKKLPSYLKAEAPCSVKT
jgi:hypothetical protein